MPVPTPRVAGRNGGVCLNLTPLAELKGSHRKHTGGALEGASRRDGTGCGALR
jgi:hypothetical protein